MKQTVDASDIDDLTPFDYLVPDALKNGTIDWSRPYLDTERSIIYLSEKDSKAYLSVNPSVDENTSAVFDCYEYARQAYIASTNSVAKIPRGFRQRVRRVCKAMWKQTRKHGNIGCIAILYADEYTTGDRLHALGHLIAHELLHYRQSCLSGEADNSSYLSKRAIKSLYMYAPMRDVINTSLKRMGYYKYYKGSALSKRSYGLHAHAVEGPAYVLTEPATIGKYLPKKQCLAWIVNSAVHVENYAAFFAHTAIQEVGIDQARYLFEDTLPFVQQIFEQIALTFSAATGTYDLSLLASEIEIEKPLQKLS